MTRAIAAWVAALALALGCVASPDEDAEVATGPECFLEDGTIVINCKQREDEAWQDEALQEAEEGFRERGPERRSPP